MLVVKFLKYVLIFHDMALINTPFVVSIVMVSPVTWDHRCSKRTIILITAIFAPAHNRWRYRYPVELNSAQRSLDWCYT